MKSQLYNATYLEQTAELLREIKHLSYQPFLNFKSGLITDIGCGTGQDVLNLATLLPPSVQMIGFDADAEMIGAARESDVPPNVTFELALAEKLPLENGSVSGLRNERLIQHLTRPALAFSEFERVMSSGAPLTIVETDWSSFSLYNAPEGLGRRTRDFFAGENVAYGSAALNLSHWLKESNFGHISLKVFPIVTSSFEQVVAFTRLDLVLDKMLAADVIDRSEFELLYQQMRSADKDEYFAASINLVVATAIKQ